MTWPILIALVCSILSSFASLLMKRAAERLSFNPLKLIRNKNLIIGIFLYVAGSVLFVWALTASQLSILYPVVALSYVWTLLLANKYLNEKITLYKWIGIILIIFGVVMITVI